MRIERYTVRGHGWGTQARLDELTSSGMLDALSRRLHITRERGQYLMSFRDEVLSSDLDAVVQQAAEVMHAAALGDMYVSDSTGRMLAVSDRGTLIKCTE